MSEILNIPELEKLLAQRKRQLDRLTRQRDVAIKQRDQLTLKIDKFNRQIQDVLGETDLETMQWGEPTKVFKSTERSALVVTPNGSETVDISDKTVGDIQELLNLSDNVPFVNGQMVEPDHKLQVDEILEFMKKPNHE